ncbi:DUF397 domain-containing protein [Streptomyces sp. CA-251387]|uniref:DUF397 domain-containing protein n=1 Tax=Streptomyces sp. CA-251387 TaxID=3240064 RepID=UPI003D8A8AA2
MSRPVSSSGWWIVVSDQLKWFKSSYSDNEGGACVELAFSVTVHVRDSKVPASPELHLTAPAWTAFISYLSPRDREKQRSWRGTGRSASHPRIRPVKWPFRRGGFNCGHFPDACPSRTSSCEA